VFVPIPFPVATVFCRYVLIYFIVDILGDFIVAMREYSLRRKVLLFLVFLKITTVLRSQRW